MVIYKLRDWIPIDKIDWFYLSINPNAISILEKNIDKITNSGWNYISRNPTIFIYDYKSMQKHFYETYGKELIQTLYNPKNFHKFGKDYWNINEDI